MQTQLSVEKATGKMMMKLTPAFFSYTKWIKLRSKFHTMARGCYLMWEISA